MYKYIALILLLLTSLTNSAQTFTDPVAAFDTASVRHKPVLLIFEGSDWCLPCIKLDRKVLSTDAFLAFAGNNIVVLKADFPQTRKIKPELEAQYNELAETFNKAGSFPKIILLNAAKQQIADIGTDYNKPEELISRLQQELKKAHEEM